MIRPFTLMCRWAALGASALVLAPSAAHAACSAHRGKVVINEYNFQDAWIELKVLDPSVTAASSNYANWKMAIWQNKGSKIERSQEEGIKSNYESTAKNTCNFAVNPTYIKIPYAGSNMGNDVIVVLWDSGAGSKGQVIDLFRLDSAALQPYPAAINAGYTEYDQCPAIESALPSSQYDAPVTGSSGNKDMARLPDGTGVWTISPGTGAGSVQTLCGSNDGGSAGAADAFNAIDGDASQTNFVAGRIYTKVAGNPFALKVGALASGAFSSSFAGTVKLELLANNTPGSGYAGASGSGANCPTSFTVVATGPAALTATLVAGQATASGISVANAVRDVRVRMTYPATGTATTVLCSTDSFSIRPASFALSTNLGASPIAAGTSFILTATSSAPGYAGTPVLLPSRVKAGDNSGAVTAALGAGMLTDLLDNGVTDIANNAFGAAGISPTLGLRYHDVGYLVFAADSVVDATFTAVDAGDCVASSGSNALIGGKPGCEIQGAAATAALGRFRPDHYELSSTITPGNAGGFTYMDQDALGLTQTLRAASATGKVPLRYAAGYPVLATATLRAMATDPATGVVTDLTSRLSAPVPTFPGIALAWASGAAGIADIYRFDARGASTPLRDGPYEDFRLRMTVVDPDGVQITRNDGAAIVATGTAESPQTKVRYGRASVSNAFGAAGIDLPLPAAVEYWTGAYWAANVIDIGGSTLSSPTIVQTSGTGTVNYTAGSVFSTSAATPGRFGLTLTSTGPAAVQLGYAAPAWLQYPWGGGATMENPRARASFGLYPGSKRFIYRREVR